MFFDGRDSPALPQRLDVLLRHLPGRHDPDLSRMPKNEEKTKFGATLFPLKSAAAENLISKLAAAVFVTFYFFQELD